MEFAKLLGLALRMARRDWRSGELRLLALAIVIAIAATTSVGFLVDRVRSALQRDAAQYLGGDVVLDSDHPIDDALTKTAAQLGLRSALALSFPSMALSDSDAQASTLVAVKAVTDGYPLRGTLQLNEGGVHRAAKGIPDSGTVWVEPQVLIALGVQQGDSLRLGNSRLRIGGLIDSEPDRAIQVMGFAPRVLMNAKDLPATGLVQPASRIAYRWMVAGETASVRALISSLAPRLQRGQHLESLDDGRPELQRSLSRADRFMRLVALLTVMISAIAVSAAARRFGTRRLDSCALMRCLGLVQNDMLTLFVLEFAAVGLLASLVGVLIGLALHFALVGLLAGLLQQVLPWPTVYPGVQGLLCGMILLLGFAVPPLEQLRRVPPVRVLRRDVGLQTPRTWLAYLTGAVGFALLLFWTAGEWRLGLIVGGGFLGCLAFFGAIAHFSMRLLQWIRRQEHRSVGWTLRFALAAMQRRRGTNLAQLVALATGLTAILALAIARIDLVDEWREQAPIDAPNRFVINIQPEQVEAIAARLRLAQIAGVSLEPMVRGRLVEIDGKKVGPESYEDPRAQALIDREFNLSYRTEPPAHNRIDRGHWFAPGAPELSIEEGIAKRLGIGLGQVLRFDVAGQMVEAKVTSIRTVNWNSMRVNFFVIMSPSLLRQAPQSFITSFYLPPQQARLMTELVRDFPNLTVIDIDQVLRQVRGMLDQLISAAQFLFVFALAAGVLVLYTALVSSHDERVREAALLRALGASREQLANAQRAELILVGALSGAMAAVGAAAVGWALARFVFDFDFVVHAWVPAAGVSGGIVAALLGGWIGMRGILETPPLASLREG